MADPNVVLVCQIDWDVEDCADCLSKCLWIIGSERAVAPALARPPGIIISDVNLGTGGTGPSAVARIAVALGERTIMATFQARAPLQELK